MQNPKLLYTALILLKGCCAHPEITSPPPVPADAMLKRVWMVTEFRTVPHEQLIQLQARLNLTQLPDAMMQLGCHDFAFRAQMNQGQIRIHALAPADESICNHDTELATQFNQFIRQAQFYRVEGHFLTLTANNGETMRFVAQDWD